MNDHASPDAPPGPPLDVGDLERTVLELRQRVQVLEDRVATLPDARQLEERITDQVVTRLPKATPAPPLDPTREPTFRDIAIPLPSAATVTTVMHSTWLVWDLIADARTMFWMLVDRRYTKAWLTRVLVILLVAMIATSYFWVPLSSFTVIGYIIDKIVVVLLTLILGLVLTREMRRYREWRAGRGT